MCNSDERRRVAISRSTNSSSDATVCTNASTTRSPCRTVRRSTGPSGPFTMTMSRSEVALAYPVSALPPRNAARAAGKLAATKSAASRATAMRTQLRIDPRVVGDLSVILAATTVSTVVGTTR